MQISNKMFKTDPNFYNHHFRTPSFSHSLDGGHTDAILAAATPAMFFQDLKSLLDKISVLVLSKLGGGNSSSRRIVFHPHIPLPPATSSRPILLGCADDIVSGKTPSPTAVRPVHSLVSCDLKLKNKEQTITDYASNFLVRRPDIHGFYVLFVDRLGYQFGWADASGIVLSPVVQWTPGDSSDVSNLVTYVHSLYFPPEDHIFFDTTIKPTIGINPNRPRFTIVAGDQSYTDCIQIFGGCVYGRRSAVFASSKQTKGDLVVIKDSFEGVSWSTTETKILEQIHEDGFVPGVVSLVHSQQVFTNGANENEPQPLEVYDTPTKDSSAHHRATKQRIVMGSKGVPLSKARSAKDILMATYDVLAVHRWIGNRRRIIHRDIAKNNILMYPQHRKDISSAKVIKDPPQVIRNILKGEKCSAGVEDASCLLIDFDGASRLEGNPAADSRSKKDLSQRRGTPMFISRSVCRTEMLRSSSSSPFVPMPQLTGDAKEMYIKTYGQETYEKYLDSGNTFHGRTYTKDSEENRNHKFTHRLDHDAESTFWLLLCTLIRAQSPNTDDDPRSLRQLACAWDTLSHHHETNSGSLDLRDHIMRYDEKAFARLLHPALRPLAPLLSSLATQVLPEYGHLDTTPHEDHLHEALSRILLQFIVDMKDDIPLEPDNLRCVDLRKYIDVYPSDSSTAIKSGDSNTKVVRSGSQNTSTKSQSKKENHTPIEGGIAGSGTKRKSGSQACHREHIKRKRSGDSVG